MGSAVKEKQREKLDVKRNLFSGIPADLPEELMEILAASENVRIERIVSRGHASPEDFWYDQDKDEFVLLVRGRAELAFAGKPDVLRLEPGDYLVIPAHTRHRVVWTEPATDTLWLAVHF